MEFVNIVTQINIAYEQSGIVIGKQLKTGTCILFWSVTDKIEWHANFIYLQFN
jgi:hypothetical protein